MKQRARRRGDTRTGGFSAQPRADGDEASPDAVIRAPNDVSVLNREPMGMKRGMCSLGVGRLTSVSVLNREPMGMKLSPELASSRAKCVSVLNREPMGMKLAMVTIHELNDLVSVLNREPMGMKPPRPDTCAGVHLVSVLNREPMGMKRSVVGWTQRLKARFSAQPRADGDEADTQVRVSRLDQSFSAQPRADGDEARRGGPGSDCRLAVSVLNREPMGMKRASRR